MIIIPPETIQAELKKNGWHSHKMLSYLIPVIMFTGVGYFGYGFGLIECGYKSGFIWAVCGCVVAMCAALMIRLQRKNNKCVKS
jgi:hypothetical protein